MNDELVSRLDSLATALGAACDGLSAIYTDGKLRDCVAAMEEAAARIRTLEAALADTPENVRRLAEIIRQMKPSEERARDILRAIRAQTKGE